MLKKILDIITPMLTSFALNEEKETSERLSGLFVVDCLNWCYKKNEWLIVSMLLKINLSIIYANIRIHIIKIK